MATYTISLEDTSNLPKQQRHTSNRQSSTQPPRLRSKPQRLRPLPTLAPHPIPQTLTQQPRTTHHLTTPPIRPAQSNHRPPQLA